MKCIKNSNIYVEGVGVINTSISFDEGIKEIGVATGEEIVVPQDAIIVPGFLDQHVHGAGGAEAGDCSLSALKQISQVLAKGGTTSFLATTATQKEEDVLSACSCVAEYMQKFNDDGAEILGIHLEGPFLSAKYKGAMKEEYILPCDVQIFERIYRASNGTIKMVTLAPEKENSDSFIRYLKEKGIVVSIGHTAATLRHLQGRLI